MRPELEVALKRLIFQAPTGSIAGPALAAAVCAAGGVGGMGITWTAPDVAEAAVRSLAKSEAGPFLVNYALAFEPLSLPRVLNAGAPIVSFSWGDPTPLLAQVHSAGAVCGVQVTTPDDARRYAETGFDFLICQGVEAGGHVQADRSLWELLPMLVDAACGIPVIAAGGIGCGADIDRALTVGASATMLGTRFVAALESRAHPDYRDLLVQSKSEDTVLTGCFSNGWPGAPQRALRNATLTAWEQAGSPAAGLRPGEEDILGLTAEGIEIERYSDAAPQLGYTGNIRDMCCYAGQSVDYVLAVQTAAQILAELRSETRAAMERRQAQARL